jgi:hypothetical protein
MVMILVMVMMAFINIIVLLIIIIITGSTSGTIIPISMVGNSISSDTTTGIASAIQMM